MKEVTIQKAAVQFGQGEPTIELLGEGLIHRSYKVSFKPNGSMIVLQCINQSTFPQPENIISNYRLIHNFLPQDQKVLVPAPVLTINKKLFWTDEDGNFWRATTFIKDSFSPSLPKNTEQAYLSAKCFATFTNALAGLDASQLNIIIPRFHDLAWRYFQFEEAIKNAHISRLLKSTHLIAEIRQRKNLVDFYTNITSDPGYKSRVMHHDCKISNILFDKETGKVICPVDLDTVMPGLFFSDIGDMFRTMSSTVEENSTRWEEIEVRKDFYKAIVKGYLEGIGNAFTTEELHHVHHAGLLMTYMQCTRFVTDFLNNDTYYKTTYPEQNLNRGLNQYILLERLEKFLKTEYGYLSGDRRQETGDRRETAVRKQETGDRMQEEGNG